MPQSGYVYIIHGLGTSYIKVGKTTNLSRRLAAVEQGVPFSIRVLYVELAHDMNEAERTLKKRYELFCTRGEWFELSPEALAYWPEAPVIVESLKPQMAHRKRHRFSVEERFLAKLTEHGPMTSRELQSKTGIRSHEATPVLLRLLDAGILSFAKVAKRREYIRLVRSPVTEVS